MATKQQKIQHLFWRAGFGANYKDIKKAEKSSVNEVIKYIFKKAEKDESIKLFEPRTESFRDMRKMLSGDKEKIKELRKIGRQQIMQLNATWLEKMVSSEAFLREKMTLFWHGHFACQTKQGYAGQLQNNLFRTHALGKFGTLLKLVARDASMLRFLNNQQNRKQAPNENFAREVMELFTLGRGHYSETDIQEAARAFTGWTSDFQGRFVFRKRQHDYGLKTFMGKTGHWEGDDILDMILEKKQTAIFLCEKIYRFFVNQNPDTERVMELANRYYDSEYDTKKLLKYIFSSDWFYEDDNIGANIKSPVEYLAGLQKQLNFTFKDQQAPVFIQKVLGQVLFYPPSVAGWAGGKDWIDSSSLLFRMRISEFLFRASDLKVAAKDSGDVNASFRGMRKFKKFQIQMSWVPFEKQFPAQNRDKHITDYLFQTTINNELLHDTNIEEMMIKALAMPEYQLC